ncbi:hypothetical protein BN159_7734 [Streptomyces davaonensis JCM 4913]|uniref:DUF742 domain-containing protein n=1 Tax=Streptomyces davaonensis (strain DSM 101723 / JCM 4913 / KCC S-0913 / 768) TaxID=1214101 RepID=K4REA1_STRDJ|nr:DUF742 domain-containing protein [Streptomyces davaonensis]CCK32113.1 hypothetical protein BN159_7734 [Streptomyces davaonensis JCM 4913]
MAHDDNAVWIEDDLGSVRPYALVHGRVRASHPELDRTSMVRASREPPATALQTHYAQVFNLCRSGPRSVAEIAATLEKPLQVVKIWLSDLLDDRYLTVPMPTGLTTATNDLRVLEDVLAGLRRSL